MQEIKVLISFGLVESLRLWEKSEQRVGGIFDITDYMIVKRPLDTGHWTAMLALIKEEEMEQN